MDKVRGKFVLDALHDRVDLGGLGDVELETRNIEPEFPGHPPGPALKRCGFLSRSGAIDPRPALVIPQRPLPKRHRLPEIIEQTEQIEGKGELQWLPI